MAGGDKEGAGSRYQALFRAASRSASMSLVSRLTAVACMARRGADKVRVACRRAFWLRHRAQAARMGSIDIARGSLITYRDVWICRERKNLDDLISSLLVLLGRLACCAECKYRTMIPKGGNPSAWIAMHSTSTQSLAYDIKRGLSDEIKLEEYMHRSSRLLLWQTRSEGALTRAATAYLVFSSPASGAGPASSVTGGGAWTGSPSLGVSLDASPAGAFSSLRDSGRSESSPLLSFLSSW